jgi:hypothetical protein
MFRMFSITCCAQVIPICTWKGIKSEVVFAKTVFYCKTWQLWLFTAKTMGAWKFYTVRRYCRNMTIVSIHSKKPLVHENLILYVGTVETWLLWLFTAKNL